MILSRRLMVLVLVAGLFLGSYGTGRYYSPALVRFIVTHALIEKSPPGMDPAIIRSRLAGLGSGGHGSAAEMAKWLAISQRLEKMQRMSAADVEELLGEDMPPP
jgi:hypothetical protein